MKSHLTSIFHRAWAGSVGPGTIVGRANEICGLNRTGSDQTNMARFQPWYVGRLQLGIYPKYQLFTCQSEKSEAKSIFLLTGSKTKGQKNTLKKVFFAEPLKSFSKVVFWFSCTFQFISKVLQGSIKNIFSECSFDLWVFDPGNRKIGFAPLFSDQQVKS